MRWRRYVMSRAEVVVVTGASAGIGRAAAVEFGRHGAKVALLARGRAGLEGAKARDRGGGRGGPGAADRRRRLRAGRRRCGGDRRGARADRRLGERRHDHDLRRVRRDRSGRVPARDGGHVSRHRLGDEGGLGADAASGPGLGGARRLGAGVPGYPLAGAVLWRQARRQRACSSRSAASCDTEART